MLVTFFKNTRNKIKITKIKFIFYRLTVSKLRMHICYSSMLIVKRFQNICLKVYSEKEISREVSSIKILTLYLLDQGNHVGF